MRWLRHLLGYGDTYEVAKSIYDSYNKEMMQLAQEFDGHYDHRAPYQCIHCGMWLYTELNAASWNGKGRCKECDKPTPIIVTDEGMRVKLQSWKELNDLHKLHRRQNEEAAKSRREAAQEAELGKQRLQQEKESQRLSDLKVQNDRNAMALTYNCTRCKLSHPGFLREQCPKCLRNDKRSCTKPDLPELLTLTLTSDQKSQAESVRTTQDFATLGNLILETMTAVNQWESWTPDGVLLFNLAKEAVSQKFALPQGKTYHMPHGDEFLKGENRNTWKYHWHIQLLIFGYVLGSRLTSLKMPHGAWVDYLLFCAERQTNELERFVPTPPLVVKQEARRPINPDHF